MVMMAMTMKKKKKKDGGDDDGCHDRDHRHRQHEQCG